MLTLAYFLLLDGAMQFQRATVRIREPERERVRRVGARIARIVRSYVSVNLLLAALAGIFTWISLELLAARDPRRGIAGRDLRRDLARPKGRSGVGRRRWCGDRSAPATG